ncbi:MAG: hypothetical protein Q7R89_03450, partial [bacterium]|nr:hypothetical protein [bacterium]
VYKQIETGHRFHLSAYPHRPNIRQESGVRKAMELNEGICRLRPVPQIEDEKEITALKNKLQRRFSRRPRKKSIA